MDGDIAALSTQYGAIHRRPLNSGENESSVAMLVGGEETDGKSQRRALQHLQRIETAVIAIAVLMGILVVAVVVGLIIFVPRVQSTMGAIEEMSHEFTRVGEHGERIADQVDELLASAKDADGAYDLSSLASMVLGDTSDDGGGGGGFLSSLLGSVFGSDGKEDLITVLTTTARRVANATSTLLDYLDELDAGDMQTIKEILPHALETLRYADEHHLLQQSLQMLEFASRVIARVRRLDLDIPDEDIAKMPAMVHEMQIAIEDLVGILSRFQEDGIRIAV